MTGNIVFAATQSPFGYAMLPAEVQQVPISIPVVGKPAASALVHVVMAMAVTLTTGGRAWVNTAPTATTTFTVNKIAAGGGTTSVGTVSFAAASKTGTFSITSTSFAVGDVLQLSAPGTQDTTFADASISFMATRV